MNNLRAVYAIWLRDVIRFKRDKARVVSSLAQPALFLFVFGNGLAQGLSINVASGGARSGYVAFIFPGIIGMTLLFTSMFAGVSIVWDREFGFLKEVMVAPIARASVAVGKALGGSTISLIQGAIVLLFSPLLGVRLSPLIIIIILPVMLLISFSLTSMGIVIAARMDSMEGVQMIMNFLIMPLFILSGAMFPLTRLPVWLRSLTRADPLSYGVDALRGLILGPKLAEFSLAFDLTVMAVFGAAMISAAVYFFERQR